MSDETNDAMPTPPDAAPEARSDEPQGADEPDPVASTEDLQWTKARQLFDVIEHDTGYAQRAAIVALRAMIFPEDR